MFRSWLLADIGEVALNTSDNALNEYTPLSRLKQLASITAPIQTAPVTAQASHFRLFVNRRGRGGLLSHRTAAGGAPLRLTHPFALTPLPRAHRTRAPCAQDAGPPSVPHPSATGARPRPVVMPCPRGRPGATCGQHHAHEVCAPSPTVPLPRAQHTRAQQCRPHCNTQAQRPAHRAGRSQAGVHAVPTSVAGNAQCPSPRPPGQRRRRTGTNSVHDTGRR